MLIRIIRDEDIGLENIELDNPKVRYASRGVIKKGNKIAIFYKENKNEYKLPGGGMDEGETPEECFIREVKEETGCEISNIVELGTIEENKGHTNFKQISHVFVGDVRADLHKLNLTEKEIIEGGKLVWVDVNTAIELVAGSFDKLKAGVDESVYMTKFVIIVLCTLIPGIVVLGSWAAFRFVWNIKKDTKEKLDDFKKRQLEENQEEVMVVSEVEGE